MALPDITVTIAIDRNTAKQLLVSWPTWQKYRPEMWNWPWVIAFDWQPPHGLLASDVQKIADIMGLDNYEAVRWPPVKIGPNEPMAEYETQRAKMVTSFLWIPTLYVTTEYWLKIDTDALALGNKPWPLPEWFEPDEHSRKNALIASPWAYTKAKGGGGCIGEWAEALECFGDAVCERSRLGLVDHISGSKIKMPRIASWLSFYRTGWTRRLSVALDHYLGLCKSVVPSQDTIAWYYAERSGDRYLRANMKRRSWTNIPSYRRLKAKAEEIMAQ